jgi:pyridoxamine 5'-phosphate oxidase
MNPFQLFNEWNKEELKLTKVRIPSAGCLSTNGLDAFPNSRFVSFKEVVEDAFIVTGPLSSRKGLEISNSNNVALTFWWTETERQIRIQGYAIKISDQMADTYFAERPLDSQIVSLVSQQGEEIESIELLNKKYKEAEVLFSNKTIARPDNWGGYAIKPIRIEFMQFKESRFHERKLYELINGQWKVKQLQP